MIHFHYAVFTQWLHIHPEWGGLAAFIIAFAESIAVVGTIVPGSVTMTAIGILAGSGVLPIWSIIIFAISGAILGDACSYFLGFYFKENIQHMWPFSRHPTIFNTGEKFFIKHGSLSVFIGRFVGPVRAIVPVIAGMLNMRPRRYFLASVPSAVAWAPVYMLPGFLLGAASLEMSSDMATTLIISVLVILILFWLIAKTIAFIYEKTHAYFAEIIDKKWAIWASQPSMKWFCTLLRHATRPNKRGQLLLAINALIAFVLFILVFSNVITHGPLLDWNNAVYHLFRGFRTPTLDKVFVIITTLGYKYILLSLSAIVLLWFIVRRHWLSAIHWFAGNLLVFGSLKFFKHIYFSPRPIGILHQSTTSSFPSGHTTLSVGIYGLLAFFIAYTHSKKFRKITCWIVAMIALSIALSRIYLGAHWLTDVIGGILLGLFCISITIISYRRYKPDRLSWWNLLFIAIVTISIATTWDLSHYYSKLIQNTKLTWPTVKISESTWWTQHSHLIPLYRRNRIGQPQELLNVQWVGSLDNIKITLQQHDWHNPHTRDYLSTIKTLAEHTAVKHQDFFPLLYNDQKPVLVLIKFIGTQSPPLILRLWKSNIMLIPNQKPLWVGTIYYDVKQHHLFFFHTKTKPIHIEDAANALIPSLIEYTWHRKIVTPQELPQKIAEKQIVDRVIVIKPREQKATIEK